MNRSIQDLGPCPCQHPRCDVVGTKVTRFGYLVGCKSPEAQGRRNRKRGKAAQRNVHQALGGAGWSPTHEEWGNAYPIEVRIEAKAGEQIPATFTRFTQLDWTRRALSQAERATPEGEQSHPAIYMEPAGGGRWLVVRL